MNQPDELDRLLVDIAKGLGKYENATIMANDYLVINQAKSAIQAYTDRQVIAELEKLTDPKSRRVNRKGAEVMSVIKFKSTRRMHDSGFRVMEKSGDLEYDLADTSVDVVWLTVTEPCSIKIDCEKDGTYRVLFDKNKVFQHNPTPPNKLNGDS